MSWREDLVLELARAADGERSGNAGRVRTCLRRAVGIVLTEWQRRDARLELGRDFLRQLRSLSIDPGTPEGVREAAERLGARLGEDFRSRSVAPMEDAKTILSYVLTRMGESPDLS